MVIENSLLQVYKEKIIAFDYTGDACLKDFLIEKEASVSICYSTHNEYINTDAEILVVGICPGRQQMLKSLNVAKRMLAQGYSDEAILKNCKMASRLYGSTRSNLIAMLAQIGIKESASLFEAQNIKLHTTSLIRYPVFIGASYRNYNGHSPKLDKNELINKYALDFSSELIKLEKLKLIIPLGKAVEDYLMGLDEVNSKTKSKLLIGLPHPSGANGHREKTFRKNQAILSAEVKRLLG
jgi:hypothetical protein